MKKIFYSCLIINIFCIGYLSYMLFIMPNINTPKESIMIDVTNVSLEDGQNQLKNYKFEINYIDSLEPYNTIIKTNPKVNSRVYQNQKIIIYVSKGKIDEYYKVVEQQLYDMALPYLNYLENTYQTNIVITKTKNNDYPDGFILKQNLKNEIIGENQTLHLEVVENSDFIKVPNFYLWKIQDIINFGIENNLTFIYTYVYSDMPIDYVIEQNISPDTLIYKRGNPIELKISKGLDIIPDYDGITIDDLLNYCFLNQIEYSIIYIASNTAKDTLIKYYYYDNNGTLAVMILLTK